MSALPLPKQNKTLSLIRGIIKDWLEGIPAFKVSDWRSFIIVFDIVYNDKLAVIEFKEDHLLINLPMPDDPYTFVTLSLKGVLGGRRIDYSDPDLHAEVKRVVNSAYGRRSQPSARGDTKKISSSRTAP